MPKKENKRIKESKLKYGGNNMILNKEQILKAIKAVTFIKIPLPIMSKRPIQKRK